MPRLPLEKETMPGDILGVVQIGTNGLISSKYSMLDYLNLEEGWVTVLSASQPNKILLVNMGEK